MSARSGMRAFAIALAAFLALLGAAAIAAAPLRDPPPRAFTPLQFAAAHPFYTLKTGQIFSPPYSRRRFAPRRHGAHGEIAVSA